ncbi:hypothetical protein [Pelagicoccus albus]|uniref:Uncharacterized protein n=1 Tax=Pelagicoccus albus TaxID=415222 RepID=A0A7X1E7H0_9BACT|nr:hypothetical protein [Pelagicoccus albus]MBC2605735.1 hypothetical protein [Pelagicoccus albus]
MKAKIQVPLVEIILAILVVLMFAAPEWLAGIFDRLPELAQLGLVFTSSPYIALSSIQGLRESKKVRRYGLLILHAILAIIGLALSVFSTIVFKELGLGSTAYTLLAIGTLLSLAILIAKTKNKNGRTSQSIQLG